MHRSNALSLALLLTACGSSISLGGPGAGGGGAGGGTAGGGTAGGNPCEPIETCNPPECPDAPPSLFEPCVEGGFVCQYDSEDCQLSFECALMGGCEPSPNGGDEPCPEAAWVPGPAECTPGVVQCEAAQEGDPCAYPGDSCGIAFDCEWQETVCGPDRRWHLQGFIDECCFEPCCESFECPPLPPEAGMPCEPCFDGPACSYEIETMCGPAPIDAWCDEQSFTWEVELPPPCP